MLRKLIFFINTLGNYFSFINEDTIENKYFVIGNKLTPTNSNVYIFDVVNNKVYIGFNIDLKDEQKIESIFEGIYQSSIGLPSPLYTKPLFEKLANKYIEEHINDYDEDEVTISVADFKSLSNTLDITYDIIYGIDFYKTGGTSKIYKKGSLENEEDILLYTDTVNENIIIRDFSFVTDTELKAGDVLYIEFTSNLGRTVISNKLPISLKRNV